ncbi:unnamed protein product [Mesocestoides corti]|uniref:Uncharacterized protein n=1 Tax=Mesocestoides corti TaxID=53468 RepID=A0A0R3URM6_MESCO|nr:unnamed protein product [Mesocestoides corti]
MSKLISTQPRSSSTSCYIPRTLSSCTQAFIRRDAIRRPLHPNYDGLFRMLRREEGVFIVERNGNEDAVFIDRMKSALLDAEMPPSHKPEVQPTPISSDNKETNTTTRYSRRVHWPDR